MLAPLGIISVTVRIKLIVDGRPVGAPEVVCCLLLLPPTTLGSHPPASMLRPIWPTTVGNELRYSTTVGAGCTLLGIARTGTINGTQLVGEGSARLIFRVEQLGPTVSTSMRLNPPY